MNDKGLVILIHGFLGAPWTMTYYEKKLNKAGFDTVKWGYPSRNKTIQEHAQALVEFLKALPQKGPVHFVTHSLGGLVLRAALSHPECPKNAKSGKAVLITPPNQGVLFGRMLSKWTLARKLCGQKSGKELLTAENFDYLGEFPPYMQVKVIAGDFNYNPFLPSPSDGQVLVEETRLNTPHEHITLPIDHLFILLSSPTADEILKTMKS